MSGPNLPKGLWSETRDSAGTRALYDDWAARYDADMESGGMVGPARLAAMLADALPDRAAPVWDFGCGTGMAGVLLHEAGFTQITGSDISPGMAEQARAKGVYREVIVSDPDTPFALPPETRAVSACGSICIGAAPAPVLRSVAEAMPQGCLLVITLNDDTIRDRDHVITLAELQIDGTLRLEKSEYGPQFEKLDRGCTVALLRRL